MVIPSLVALLEEKPLYYKEIDHKRVHRAYQIVKDRIDHPKTIHIVGTNGKGSTGRAVAHLAHKSGLNTGHFSSPHILKFNERIWINGSDISDEALESSHQKLYKILGVHRCKALSYFEYTTLLALVAFEELDLIILEAGLGGEHDATNVCDKVLSIVTPIGIDHQQFLGETIEEIATTKIKSIQKRALISSQPYSQVEDIAREIATHKEAELFFASGDIQKNEQSLIAVAKEKGWPEYLIQNILVSLQALDILDISYDINDLYSLELFGRFYPIRDNVRIDVGHNLLAAKAIAKAIDGEVVLIYNSLDDKDYESVLRTFKSKVKWIEILPIESQRAVTTHKLTETLESIDIFYRTFDGSINESENYLVFGSFYLVEAFLKEIDYTKES